jgi:hypothetical protein
MQAPVFEKIRWRNAFTGVVHGPDTIIKYEKQPAVTGGQTSLPKPRLQIILVPVIMEHSLDEARVPLALKGPAISFRMNGRRCWRRGFRANFSSGQGCCYMGSKHIQGRRQRIRSPLKWNIRWGDPWMGCGTAKRTSTKTSLNGHGRGLSGWHVEQLQGRLLM